MIETLSKSEFVEADITYNETREYLNMVAFNYYTTMDWMVISCVRLTRQNAEAYALVFSKTFASYNDNHEDFEVGKSLLGI